MSLDLYMLVPKHTGFSMSQQDFHELRKKLAAEIGIQLDEMEGFGGEGKFEDWNDPLIPFLHQAEDEETMSPSVCSTVYPRILDLIVEWENDEYKEKARDLAITMKTCEEEGCALLFEKNF